MGSVTGAKGVCCGCACVWLGGGIDPFSPGCGCIAVVVRSRGDA